MAEDFQGTPRKEISVTLPVNTILVGDVLERLKALPDECVHMCVTSPPYWRLRDYGVAGQIGLERTPEEYVGRLVEVFREVRRTLRPDGTVFLNMGDSYSQTEFGRIRNHEKEAFFGLSMEVRRQVFALWRRALGGSVPGNVRDLLPEGMEDEKPEQDAGARKEVLRDEQGKVSSQDRGTEQDAASGDDEAAWREVCVLWDHGADVPLSRPHQGGRTTRVRENGRHERSVEESDSGRVESEEVPDSLLELQRRAWALWAVSTLQLDLHNIPREARRLFTVEIKPKDLCGIPWRVAFTLQADGWYLRMDNVWQKPNPMPSSVRDRPTMSHEYVFLLSKSQRYFYDNEAVKEPLSEATVARVSQATFDGQKGGPKDYAHGTNPNASSRRALVNLKARILPPQIEEDPERWAALTGRNKRSVWTIAARPFTEELCSACGRGYERMPAGKKCLCGRDDSWVSHFAVFPPELAAICVLAGTSERGCCDVTVKKLRLRADLTEEERAIVYSRLGTGGLL